MKPRVFVSSTYYDLKYLRERIELFLSNYGFDTVLFESNNVTYEHGKAIDTSVYKELELCHIMILIVGGRYGSASSSETPSADQQKIYDDEYISITRREFETAVERNIPIFIFIDKNVYGDYENYKKNETFFKKITALKNAELDFQFVHVDSINIFKFIDSLITKPLKTFEKVEEIEQYLQSQLAGIFYLYLESLQKQTDDKKILTSVEELNNVTKRMSEMLDSVGKKVLEGDQQEYQEVIDKQFDILINYYASSVVKNITFERLTDESIDDQGAADYISKMIYDKVLNDKFDIPELKTAERRKYISTINIGLKEDLNFLLKLQFPSVTISELDGVTLNRNFYKNVKPFLRDENESVTKIVNKISDVLYIMV